MAAFLLASAVATSARAAAPSQDISSYVLFALSSLRSKGLTTSHGGVAVNAPNGMLFSHGPIFVPDGELVSDFVRVDQQSICADLVSNHPMGTGPKCGPPQGFTAPVIADPAFACGYPPSFPKCDPSKPVDVGAGVARTLSPGVYGTVHVTGGGQHGSLILNPGTYTFCDVKVARAGQILAAGPTVVNVDGTLTLGTASRTAPQTKATSAADVRFNVSGRRVRFARRSTVHARLCAPHAMLRITTGTTVEGSFLADTIHTEKLSGDTAGPGDPCLGNHCGDGVVNCGEVCDPAGPPVACPGDSASGAFRICTPGCGSFDDSQCNGGSTTSTTASTTTTTSSSGTTTTTNDPCAGQHCGDGVVNCGEVCDPNDEPVPCPGGSPLGALLDDSTTGAFRICNATCDGFDDSQCNGGSTTTTVPTTTLASSTTIATTTTVSSSTTTTDVCSTDAHCGDGIVDCGEVCDPEADPVPCVDSAENAFLAESSAGGAFRICNATCDGFDDSQCNATTTTTFVSTTTTKTSTTTTTLDVCTSPAAHCGDGKVDCDEACDPTAVSQPLCNAGSPGGGFVGCTADCQIDRGQCAKEICGNCIDDDGDGLVDFDDPDCCSQTQTVAMDLRKARIRPSGTDLSKLRIRSRLGQKPSFGADISKQDVFVQISPQETSGALCASIPNAKFAKKSARRMLFRDRKGTIASAEGLQRVLIRINKKGQIRFLARGKKVHLSTPKEGSLKVTVGLHAADATDNSANQCSSVLQRFIGTPRLGGVRAP